MNAEEHFAALREGLDDDDVDDLQPTDAWLGAHLFAVLDRLTAAIEAQTAAAVPYYELAMAHLAAQKQKIDAVGWFVSAPRGYHYHVPTMSGREAWFFDEGVDDAFDERPPRSPEPYYLEGYVDELCRQEEVR